MTLSAHDWLTLLRAPGVGNHSLLALFEQAPDIKQLDDLLHLPGESLPDKLRHALLHPDEQQIENDLQWLSHEQNHLVSIFDNNYPELLKSIDDAPVALFASGDIELLHQPQIAIVGSRNPSRGGSDNAFAFARHLAASGFTITSGLAAGIDASAHRGALAAPGTTIAVTATGLDRVYPAQHRELAHQIADSGLLVSEFPPGTPPRAGHFPRRNRLISGLSLGTLIVEAAIQSGSLITARLASEQGREVFAIPGSIHNPLSKGCHRLIKQGAKLVETAQDIVDELKYLIALLPDATIQPQSAQASSTQAVENIDPDYALLLDAMGWDPQPIENIITNSGLKAEAVSSMLLLLELQGHVSSAPGGYYNRTVPAD
ncbi:MAG: DNA-processing protein DprA [Chromatiales bacterium]|jgi:DNA processing protein